MRNGLMHADHKFLLMQGNLRAVTVDREWGKQGMSTKICWRYVWTTSNLNVFNPLTPNDPYRGRTATLTSKVAFYIFIQQI